MWIAMTYILTAYTLKAIPVIVLCSYGLHSYGLYSYDPTYGHIWSWPSIVMAGKGYGRFDLLRAA